MSGEAPEETGQSSSNSPILDTPSNPSSAVLSVKDWTNAWEERNIGFHKDQTAPLLVKHIDLLVDGRGALKVLVPLCGKSLDLKWLSDQGHTVIGVEFVEQAILEFFKEQNVDYTKEALSDIDGDLYKSTDGKILIYRCDFFDFNRSYQGDFDAIWDRAAFVAINRGDLEKYASLIKSLASPGCRMIIVTLDYDATKWGGPPHYTPDGTIQELYGDEFIVTTLDRESNLDDRWIKRGLTFFDEVLHFLTHK